MKAQWMAIAMTRSERNVRCLPFSLGKRICIAQALSGLALLLVLAQNIVLVATGLALFGAFSAPLTIWAQTLRMQIIPESLQG